eukprot:15442111-Alexandrium_andersonii.AAC.1
MTVRRAVHMSGEKRDMMHAVVRAYTDAPEMKECGPVGLLLRSMLQLGLEMQEPCAFRHHSRVTVDIVQGPMSIAKHV